MTRTFWLSFADENRPSGDQFLGVAVVDVTDAEIEAARPFLPPTARVGAEFIMAAIRKAHALGCNPGGQVRLTEVPVIMMAETPRGVLLSRAQLVTLGHIDEEG